MKTRFSFGKLAFPAIIAATLTMSVSCEKTPSDGPGKGGYAAEPFSRISVTADGETVDGVADHQALTILFAFDKAENFSGSRLDVALNDGYTLSWPSDPSDYEAGEDIYFKSQDKKNVIYSVAVTSSALPVADASKITVEGGYPIIFSPSAKEFIITYQAGMDRSNVVIVFGEGALIEGASVSQKAWDLSDGPSVVSVMSGGVEREFTVRLDYTAAIKSPSEWGFSDITASDWKAKYPSLSVWKAESLLKQVPAQNTGAETDQWWNCNGSVETQIAKCGFLGDYPDSREKVSIASCEFYIATFDAASFSGNLVAEEAPDYVRAAISMTGAPAAQKPMLKIGGNMVKAAGESWWEGNFGTFVGFTGDGTMKISQAASVDGTLKVLPYFNYEDFGIVYGERVTDDNFRPRKEAVSYAGEVWDVTDATYVNPMVVRDGRKLTYIDLLINDGDSETFGHGYNSMGRTRSFIGKTLDNKIGLALVTSKSMTISQAAYVLYELGWTDICYAGGDYYAEDSFMPSLFIDGVKVAGINDQNAACVYCFNAR